MLSTQNPYNASLPWLSEMRKISGEEITHQLSEHVGIYKDCFVRSQQIRYFETFVTGLLSNIERKSVEPIALSFLGEKEVRGMQQFFTRSKGWDETVSHRYKEQLSHQISSPEGF